MQTSSESQELLKQMFTRPIILNERKEIFYNLIKKKRRSLKLGKNCDKMTVLYNKTIKTDLKFAMLGPYSI